MESINLIKDGLIRVIGKMEKCMEMVWLKNSMIRLRAGGKPEKE